MLVTDLQAGRVAAFMAWHFEGGATGRGRSRATRLRPHLVVSAGLPDSASDHTRGAYTVMLWHLFMCLAAIDRATVQRGRVGLQLDSAVLLTAAELESFGLRKGPSTRSGGYADRSYYELAL